MLQWVMGSSLTSSIRQSSPKAGGHCSSFAPNVSQSSARVGCRCPFSHTLIRVLQRMVGYSVIPATSQGSVRADCH